jgi:hypothetical protein
MRLLRTATCLWLAASGSTVAAPMSGAAPTPELVAPGQLSTRQGEYSPSYHAERAELYFMRRTPGRFDYALYVSREVNGAWTEPALLPFSGLSRDDAPFITADGNQLYFDSRRPASALKAGSINLWRVDRLDDGWGEPVLLTFPSAGPDAPEAAGDDEFGPVLTGDGTLWFYSFRPPYREGRHYRAAPPDFEAVAVETELPDPSAPTFVSYFYLTPDGNTALLEGRAEGRGRRDSDLYFACRGADGRWSAVMPLAQLNTGFGEGGPALGTDGRSLWFTSDRPSGHPEAGDANLWRVSTDALPVPCGSG